VGPVLIILLVVIGLLLVGGVVIGLAVELFWYLLIGIVLGVLGRAVLPGQQQIGYVATALAGIAGSILGGIIADILNTGGVVQFLIAIVCAAGAVAILDGTSSSART
jgi:uncharacterized membrane protein YeaQ/YmgE (transglycosylase-associated protein family)